MSHGELPVYLEMFPELTMAEVARLPLRTRWVIWRTNEQKEVGSAQVTWHDYAIEIDYLVRKLPEHLAGWSPHVPDRGCLKLSVRPVARGSHSFRYHLLCRVCGRYVHRLFFRTPDWACQSCQDLRHRSTYIPAAQRFQEEYDILRYELEYGRPIGMRGTEYFKKVDRKSLLALKLDGRHRRPGPEFDFQVYAEWHDMDPGG